MIYKQCYFLTKFAFTERLLSVRANGFESDMSGFIMCVSFASMSAFLLNLSLNGECREISNNDFDSETCLTCLMLNI